jgi:hypothetical protein
MLRSGFDPSIKDVESGCSAILYATKNKYSDELILKLLSCCDTDALEKDKNGHNFLNQRNNFGRKPLQFWKKNATKYNVKDFEKSENYITLARNALYAKHHPMSKRFHREDLSDTENDNEAEVVEPLQAKKRKKDQF